MILVAADGTTLLDIVPTYSIAAANANQPDGTSGTTDYTFTVTRSGTYNVTRNGNGETLTYSVAGTGPNPTPASLFQNPTGSIFLPADSPSANITIKVNGAQLYASDTFAVTLASVNGTVRRPPPPARSRVERTLSPTLCASL